MFTDLKTAKSIEENNQGINDYYTLNDLNATIDIYCQDLKETYRLKNGFAEGLVFAIHNEEFREWRLNYK
jgi:hypothetical protein